jgi:hypothetical protein
VWGEVTIYTVSIGVVLLGLLLVTFAWPEDDSITEDDEQGVIAGALSSKGDLNYVRSRE